MKPTKQKMTAGYERLVVNLGKGNQRKVSHLVCEVFHGPRPEGYHVAHRNGNSLDNRAENVRWATRSENEMDKVNHGTSNRGIRQWMARLTDEDVMKIRKLYATGQFSQRELADMFNIRQPNVSNIINRKRWGWLP